MKTAHIASVALALTLPIALTACAGGQQRRGPPAKVINRVLATAPGAAQPSTIVATELAFARAAREQGQWTAYRSFSAPGAVLHGSGGVTDATRFLNQRPDPATAIQWAPRTVVMSCDGALALALGRFQDTEGFVGNYVTAWARQSDNSYKWIYDANGRDNPQPPPRQQQEEGEIIVTAINAIAGLVATCPSNSRDRDEGVPPPPPMAIGEDGKADAQLSRDGTLRWQWEHRPDGTKFVKAEYFYEGAWEVAFEESLASAPEQ